MKDYKIKNEEIFSLIHSVEEKEIFLFQAEMFSNLLYDNKKNISDILKEQFPYEQKKILLDLFQNYNLDLGNHREINEFLISLGKTLKSLPIVNITLAFPPSESLIKRINDWFMEKFESYVLFSFEINPGIVGGAIIKIQGIVGDYSLIKYINKIT